MSLTRPGEKSFNLGRVHFCPVKGRFCAFPKHTHVLVLSFARLDKERTAKKSNPET